MSNMYHRPDEEEIKKHFLERLDERYGIKGISYEEVLKSPCKGIYSKGTNTVMKIDLGRRRILALWNKKQKMYKTALPPESEFEVRCAIKTCFYRVNRRLANKIYDAMCKELEETRVDFDSNKEAAIYYYKNCSFPHLLMRKFKGKTSDAFIVCKKIQNILEGKDKDVGIKIKLKKKYRE